MIAVKAARKIRKIRKISDKPPHATARARVAMTARGMIADVGAASRMGGASARLATGGAIAGIAMSGAVRARRIAAATATM
jgi:hypothetical protein